MLLTQIWECGTWGCTVLAYWWHFANVQCWHIVRILQMFSAGILVASCRCSVLAYWWHLANVQCWHIDDILQMFSVGILAASCRCSVLAYWWHFADVQWWHIAGVQCWHIGGILQMFRVRILVASCRCSVLAYWWHLADVQCRHIGRILQMFLTSCPAPVPSFFIENFSTAQIFVTLFYLFIKRNVIPIPVLTGSQESSSLRMPKFLDNWRRKVASLYHYAPATFTPKEISFVLISVKGWVEVRAIVKVRAIVPIGNRTCDLQTCSAVLQPTATPLYPPLSLYCCCILWGL
jgi:hypothetical protein